MAAQPLIPRSEPAVTDAFCYRRPDEGSVAAPCISNQGADLSHGILHVEEVALPLIAERVGTPLYCTSKLALIEQYRRFDRAFDGLERTICYAVKANSTLAVIHTLAAEGAGADVVSEGELTRALVAGVPADKIVFSGVGKTKREMVAALRARILQINVESLEELEALNQVASELAVRAQVGLRVNPAVDAGTHGKINTGPGHSKFGLSDDQLRQAFQLARSMPYLELVSLGVHIGSQVTAVEPFRQAFDLIADLTSVARRQGLVIRRVDLGGGLGTTYHPGDRPPSIEEYAEVARKATAGLDCALILEPGRILVGQASALLTRVLYVKRNLRGRLIILDAGMNDLHRPALYEAYHPILPVRATGGICFEQGVVGPVCESGDCFAWSRSLPEVQAGDLMVVTVAGAYGSVMASQYNGRPLVPEVLVSGRSFEVVRRRPSVDETLSLECLPDMPPSSILHLSDEARPCQDR